MVVYILTVRGEIRGVFSNPVKAGARRLELIKDYGSSVVVKWHQCSIEDQQAPVV